jgi:hypothetical protein
VTNEFYTVPEMAELLRVHPGTIGNRLWLRADSLPPSMAISHPRLFPRAAYEAWKQPRLAEQRDV